MIQQTIQKWGPRRNELARKRGNANDLRQWPRCRLWQKKGIFFCIDGTQYYQKSCRFVGIFCFHNFINFHQLPNIPSVHCGHGSITATGYDHSGMFPWLCPDNFNLRSRETFQHKKVNFGFNLTTGMWVWPQKRAKSNVIPRFWSTEICLFCHLQSWDHLYFVV